MSASIKHRPTAQETDLDSLLDELESEHQIVLAEFPGKENRTRRKKIDEGCIDLYSKTIELYRAGGRK